MTKKTNPFMNFDMYKSWTDFDPSKATEQFTKMFSDMNLPKVDVDALTASQHKSVEALNVANQMVLDGVRAVAERQSEIIQEAVQKSSNMFQSMGNVANPQEAVEKQIDLAKGSYDKAVKDMNELGSMISKVNADAIAPISARIQEGFAEAKTMSAAAGK